MSNTEGGVERSVRRHRASIWGIVIALVLAGAALLVFAPWRPSPDTPVQSTQPDAMQPAGTDAGPVGTTTGPATSPATPATTN